MADNAREGKIDVEKPPPFQEALDDFQEGQMINASGHVQELDRHFGLWSLCAVGIAADNAWGAGMIYCRC